MRSVELAVLRFGAYLMGRLPDRIGQFRVAQWYWWRRRPEHRLLSQRLADGTQLELDIGDRTQALAYLTRRYSEDLIVRIVRALPSAGLFVDVGANVGLVTFQVAHRRPDVRIVAFEPNPAAVAAWRRNWRHSSSQLVTLEESAVTDRCGLTSLDAPSTDLGAGLVAPDGSGVQVPTTDLDTYCASRGLDRIDVMKVDIEGSEPDLLRGAAGVLRSGAVRLLLIEFNDGHLASRGSSRGELVQFLTNHGMVPISSLDGDDVSFVARGP